MSMVKTERPLRTFSRPLACDGVGGLAMQDASAGSIVMGRPPSSRLIAVEPFAAHVRVADARGAQELFHRLHHRRRAGEVVNGGWDIANETLDSRLVDEPVQIRHPR